MSPACVSCMEFSSMFAKLNMAATHTAEKKKCNIANIQTTPLSVPYYWDTILLS